MSNGSPTHVKILVTLVQQVADTSRETKSSTKHGITWAHTLETFLKFPTGAETGALLKPVFS